MYSRRRRVFFCDFCPARRVKAGKDSAADDEILTKRQDRGRGRTTSRDPLGKQEKAGSGGMSGGAQEELV